MSSLDHLDPKQDMPTPRTPSVQSASGHLIIVLPPRRVRFGLGQVVATPGALSLLDAKLISPLALIGRHASGDWGDICADDRGVNETALTDGSRIMSVYRLVDAARLAAVPTEQRHRLPTVWVITEAVGDDGFRRSTTLLLPSEY